MDAWDKERVRTFRGVIGWTMLGLWIVCWWLRLDAIKHAALAAGCPHTFFGDMNDVVFGHGASCRGSINGDFFNGMVGVVITSPLAFLIAHPLAKAWVRLNNKVEAEQAERQERERQEAYAASITTMSAKSKQEETRSRQSNDRYEIITRLGAVDDQLVVLDGETKPADIKLIKLNIGQSIRDIHAKFTDDALRTMYENDDGLRSRVDRTLAEMRRLQLGESRFYEDLAGVFLGMKAAE